MSITLFCHTFYIPFQVAIGTFKINIYAATKSKEAKNKISGGFRGAKGVVVPHLPSQDIYVQKDGCLVIKTH